MKKSVVIKLKNKIKELEEQFSNIDREYNYNKESFKAVNIVPLSDSVALVTLKKNTEKHSNALFIYVKNFWFYFFPTDSHELGIFNYLNNKYRIYLEEFNFDKNFNIKEEKTKIDNMEK